MIQATVQLSKSFLKSKSLIVALNFYDLLGQLRPAQIITNRKPINGL